MYEADGVREYLCLYGEDVRYGLANMARHITQRI